jgi:hypothetical protein
MYREQSKYKDHPRITWFGIGGTVAYVDYAGASEPYAYFIGGNGQGAFVVVPYLAAGEEDEQGGFTSIDEGIGYALARCDEQSRAEQYAVLEATSVDFDEEDDVDVALDRLREARRVIASRRKRESQP